MNVSIYLLNSIIFFIYSVSKYFVSLIKLTLFLVDIDSLGFIMCVPTYINITQIDLTQHSCTNFVYANHGSLVKETPFSCLDVETHEFKRNG